MQSEDQRTEYKVKLTDQLEKEVVGFLNSREGGIIYIGVADDGQVIGVDDIDVLQRKIIDRIRNNIEPSVMGLFDVLTQSYDGKNVLQILILSGSEKPYYIRNMENTIILPIFWQTITVFQSKLQSIVVVTNQI